MKISAGGAEGRFPKHEKELILKYRPVAPFQGIPLAGKTSSWRRPPVKNFVQQLTHFKVCTDHRSKKVRVVRLNQNLSYPGHKSDLQNDHGHVVHTAPLYGMIMIIRSLSACDTAHMEPKKQKATP
eukprot:1162091-Pelagomonas_calceolata.AAC.3